MAALDKGAEDFSEEEEAYFVITPADQLIQIKEALDGAGFPATEVSIEMIPKMLIPCEGENKEKNEALIEWLENIEDVDEVYHNMEI